MITEKRLMGCLRHELGLTKERLQDLKARIKVISTLMVRVSIYLIQTNGLINNINAKNEHGV